VPAAASFATSSPGPHRLAPPAITKVLVFVVENHSLAQMRRSMPRVHAFASRYAYASDYTAIRHPSLPNYIAMVSGSTLGITDDGDPAAHPLRANNVFRQALAHQRTAKVYADSMPGPCYLHNAGEYAVRHNPWTYFVRDRSSCRRYDLPAARLRPDVADGRLPTVGFVIPNLVHDAHDASLAAADRWISRRIDLIRSGPDWTSGQLAIVLTADEDDSHHGNRVLTLVASRYQQHKVVGRHLTHYSLTRLLDSVIGAPPLRNARRAPSMRSAFAMP
jgi:acid phosphatase